MGDRRGNGRSHRRLSIQELIGQAAQGEVLHNDDTTMKVLALMHGNSQNQDLAEDSEPAAAERTGVFTSGIVSTRQGRQIALFFTGRQHAGENLTDVLRRRATELGPPIQMCDALSRNQSKDFEAILANCMAHARRQFVEVAQSFPRAVPLRAGDPACSLHRMMRWPKSKACRPSSACTSTNSAAAR